MCRWHTLDNVQHNSRGTQRFQSCGHYNMPDMLTVGQGAQTREEYRSQMALFAAMGSPLIIVTRTEVPFECCTNRTIDLMASGISS